MSLSVLTLNVGGINENPYEYYDVYHKNGQNLTNLERFSKSMKEELKEFAELSGLNNTSFLNLIRKTFPIGTKNRTQMNAVNPILTNIWFGAKELDRIFATSGFAPDSRGKLNAMRFNIIYNPGPVFEFISSNSNKSNPELFMDAWLNFIRSGGVGEATTIEALTEYLKNKDNNVKKEADRGKNKKFLIPENVRGLILFDYLLMKAFIRSGLTPQEFIEIGSRGQFLDNAAKIVFINQILESEEYNIIFLQEVDAGMMFSQKNTLNSINNSKKYRQYGSQGSVILVHKELPSFRIIENTNMNIRRNNNGNITNSSEILSIYSEEANCCLVSAHLESKEEKAIPQFQRMIKKLNKFINSCTFIMGIDSNISTPLYQHIGLQNKLKMSPGDLITSRKIRTWLQTQMDKADKESVKTIDYIITNQNINNTKVLSKLAVNNRNSSGILTPNQEWPFDHFGVASVIDMISYSQPNNQLEEVGVEENDSFEGGKKKKRTSKKKKTTLKKKKTTLKKKKTTSRK